MPDIYPRPDESVGALMSELSALDLVYDKDFWLHYTWDMQPYVPCTEEAYQVWLESLPAAADQDAADPAGQPEGDGTQEDEGSSTEEAEDDDPDSDKDTGSGDSPRAGGSRRATKRR